MPNKTFISNELTSRQLNNNNLTLKNTTMAEITKGQLETIFYDRLAEIEGENLTDEQQRQLGLDMDHDMQGIGGGGFAIPNP